MEPTYADSWSDMAQPCDMELWVIARSSDFVITWGLFDVCTSYFGSMNQYDPMFDLNINVGHCDLYSMI